MIPIPKYRAALLGAAVVALTTPALAYYYYVPVGEDPIPLVAEPTTTVSEPAVTIAEPTSTDEPAVPSAEPINRAEAPPMPMKEPSTTVYGERKTSDQLINDDVVKVIASDTRLSGYIGVETRNNIVTLNGRVTTPGQAYHAGRDAQSVDGVREVRNDLRTRVGGAT